MNGSAAQTVLLVGPPRPHRDHVTRVLAAHWPVVTLDHEGQALRYLGGQAGRGTPCAVVVVLCDTLPEAQACWVTLKPAAQSCHTPVLLVVASQDLLPGWEGLADDVVCGAWEPALLHLRVSVLQRQHHLRLEVAAERKRAQAARDEADRAQNVLQAMARYLSPVVLTHIQNGRASLPPRRENLSVLFSDIRGFTDASAFSTPEELVELLGEYLVEVNGIITHWGGALDKFMGDGILAYFAEDPDRTQHHAWRAVAASLRVLERLEELKVTWFERGFLPVGVGVGVTTGSAITGTIGVGARLDHTVIGPTVNLAARLQALARGGEVVVDEDTRVACGGVIKTRDTHRATVKGFEAPVTVHVVTALGAP